MSLNLPVSIDKFSHEDIVRILIKLNPRFYRPNRGSWPQGIPDLENANREVVEVALTKLRDAWGQCLYYYRSGATHIHLVLSPKHYLDYKTKEITFIKANPLPNVTVYVLPELKIKSFLLPKKRKVDKIVHVPVPKLGFIITDEDREKEEKLLEKSKLIKKKTKKLLQSLPQETKPRVEPQFIIEDPELEGDIDLEKYYAQFKPKELEQVFTKNHCVDCGDFKLGKNSGKYYCAKYLWIIDHDLAERDAVCEE